MRRILLTLLTLLAIDGFGQTWIDYKVDDNLTVSIPDNFTVMDTLGQTIIRSSIDNALVMIQRIPNKGETAAVIQFEENLIKAYEGFQNGIIRSQKGKLKSQQWIEKSRVQLNEFSYYASQGEEKQIRHCLALFINNYWYAIQFWEVESMTDELAAEREKLFSSIRLPEGVSRENQTSNGDVKLIVDRRLSAYQVGYYGAMFLGFNLIVGFVVGAVLVILKIARRKKTSTTTLEKIKKVAEEKT